MVNHSYANRIQEAHVKGHLFAHMFESPVDIHGLENTGTTNLLDVMAGKPGARYSNNYNHAYTATDHGIVGLATTALNKKYPVHLWTEMCSVGLLMDSAKPVLVNSGDAYTRVAGGHIHFSRDEKHTPLRNMQNVLFCKPFINLKENLEQRFLQAEAALSEFWNHIAGIGWDTYTNRAGDEYPAINEVNVAANLKDICGIVVEKDLSGNRNFAESVAAAVELKQHLLDTYPDQFDRSLPIVTYNIVRNPCSPGETKTELVELDDKRIHSITENNRAIGIS